MIKTGKLLYHVIYIIERENNLSQKTLYIRAGYASDVTTAVKTGETQLGQYCVSRLRDNDQS